MTDRPDPDAHTDAPAIHDPTLDIVRQVMAEAERAAPEAPQPVVDPEVRPDEPPAPQRARWRPWTPLVRHRTDGRAVPRWGRIGVLMIALAAVVNPVAVAAVLTALCLVPIIAYLTLGHDRSREIVVAAHDRLAARNPAKAAGLRRKLGRVRAGLARVLNWLPGGLGAALEPEPVPDAMRERMAADPFGRLTPEPERRC